MNVVFLVARVGPGKHKVVCTCLACAYFPWAPPTVDVDDFLKEVYYDLQEALEGQD